jgi:uncharacterized membrane protein
MALYRASESVFGPKIHATLGSIMPKVNEEGFAMPSVEHKAVVNAPIAVVWQYLEDMSNWAPFLKGYQRHEEINDRESIWTLKGDIGVLCRVVEIKITVNAFTQNLCNLGFKNTKTKK